MITWGTNTTYYSYVILCQLLTWLLSYCHNDIEMKDYILQGFVFGHIEVGECISNFITLLEADYIECNPFSLQFMGISGMFFSKGC